MTTTDGVTVDAKEKIFYLTSQGLAAGDALAFPNDTKLSPSSAKDAKLNPFILGKFGLPRFSQAGIFLNAEFSWVRPTENVVFKGKVVGRNTPLQEGGGIFTTKGPVFYHHQRFPGVGGLSYIGRNGLQIEPPFEVNDSGQVLTKAVFVWADSRVPGTQVASVPVFILARPNLTTPSAPPCPLSPQELSSTSRSVERTSAAVAQNPSCVEPLLQAACKQITSGVETASAASFGSRFIPIANLIIGLIELAETTNEYRRRNPIRILRGARDEAAALKKAQEECVCQSKPDRSVSKTSAYTWAGIPEEGGEAFVLLLWDKFNFPAGMSKDSLAWALFNQRYFNPLAYGWRNHEGSPIGMAFVHEHPFGHPDQIGPQHPPHHACPHFHAKGAGLAEKIFEYRPNSP